MNTNKNSKTKWIAGPALMMMGAILFSNCSLATTGPMIKKYDNPRAALLVLDIQRDFTGKDARMPIAAGKSDELIKSINTAIREAERRGDLVVYIGNEFSPYSPANLFRNFAAIRGRPGAGLDERLYVGAGRYFAKDFPDAFSNASLGKYLEQNRVNRLTIVGVFADQCVLHTARGARNRNYSVQILAASVAAKDARDYEYALKEYASYGIAVRRNP